MQPLAFIKECVSETLRVLRKKNLRTSLPIRATLQDTVRRRTPDDYDHNFAYVLTGKNAPPKETNILLTVQDTITLTDEPQSDAEEYCTTITRSLTEKDMPQLYAIIPESATTFLIDYRFRAS